jgi:hypothetical protein
VVEWIFQNRKGLRKFKNFEMLLGNDARTSLVNDYVLIGDTGERDEDAGERIASRYPSHIRVMIWEWSVLRCDDNHNDVDDNSMMLIT